MGKLPGWFDGLLGATQGAHVPAASPVVPSMDQPGKGHPTIRSVLLEDFPVCKGGSEHQGQLFPRDAGFLLYTGGLRLPPLPVRPACTSHPTVGGRAGLGRGRRSLRPGWAFPQTR